jgi:hypothetical protein
MYQATNSRKRSSLRASRPISVAVVLDGGFAFLAAAFSATALSLVCFFMTLKDVFDTFWDDLVAAMHVARLAMISPLCRPRRLIRLTPTVR